MPKGSTNLSAIVEHSPDCCIIASANFLPHFRPFVTSKFSLDTAETAATDRATISGIFGTEGHAVRRL